MNERLEGKYPKRSSQPLLPRRAPPTSQSGNQQHLTKRDLFHLGAWKDRCTVRMLYHLVNKFVLLLILPFTAFLVHINNHGMPSWTTQHFHCLKVYVCNLHQPSTRHLPIISTVEASSWPSIKGRASSSQKMFEKVMNTNEWTVSRVCFHVFVRLVVKTLDGVEFDCVCEAYGIIYVTVSIPLKTHNWRFNSNLFQGS